MGARARDLLRAAIELTQRVPFLRGRQRRRILPLAVAALLVCVAVAVAVGTIPPPDPLTGRPTHIPLVPRLDGAAVDLLLVLVGAATLALGAGAAAYLIVGLAQPRTATVRNSAPWKIIITVLVIMLLIYVGIAFILSLLVLPEEEPMGLPRPEPGEGEAEEQEAAEEPPPEEELLTAATRARRRRILLLTALLAGFAATIYFSVRLMRSTAEAAPLRDELPEELRRDLVAAAELGLDQLAADPDYRRAVIGCWIFLEQTLARHDHPRAAHLTPLEYVRALVTEMRSLPATALVQLTGIYELARFSTHDVTRDHRDTALARLQDIHRGLQGLA